MREYILISPHENERGRHIRIHARSSGEAAKMFNANFKRVIGFFGVLPYTVTEFKGYEHTEHYGRKLLTGRKYRYYDPNLYKSIKGGNL